METHSSILAWRILQTVEPGRLQSIGSQRVRHNWSDRARIGWGKCGAWCFFTSPPSDCFAYDRAEAFESRPDSCVFHLLLPHLFLEVINTTRRRVGIIRNTRKKSWLVIQYMKQIWWWEHILLFYLKLCFCCFPVSLNSFLKHDFLMAALFI